MLPASLHRYMLLGVDQVCISSVSSYLKIDMTNCIFLPTPVIRAEPLSRSRHEYSRDVEACVRIYSHHEHSLSHPVADE